MQSAAMAKKASEAPPPIKPDATTVVPDKLGGGEARLYSLKRSSLPDVPNPPAEKELAECEWWLVHFPSRRCVAVHTRPNGLAALKALGRGEDKVGLLPPARPKKVKAPSKPKPEADPGGDAKDEKPPSNRLGFTPVPEGADFDQAMQSVFPVARLTQNFERLLQAEEEIFDKEGNVVGARPAFTTQFQTLKALMEYHQGRPREKEKKVMEKPVLTLAQLREKLLASPEYRAAMMEMIHDCEQESKRRAGALVQPEGGKAA
jgi:hypothetical protein